MTALEYMEKQIQKHQRSYEREMLRGATEEMLYNIKLKISHYEAAVEALRFGEVVRCKYCKHCKKYRNRLDPMRNHQMCVRMDKYAFGVEEDDFCSYGERKENDL